MNKSPQKQHRPDVKHSLLALLFVFSCLLMSGCSDDDPVSRGNQDVGTWLLPGGVVQIHVTLTLDLHKELNWYRKSITDAPKERAVKNVTAVLEDGQLLETTLEEEGNYMYAKVHFKPPRTGSVKFTIVYTLENAVCKIEDNGHQKLRLSWFEEYDHEVPKSTFRLKATAGSPKLVSACFGEETSGELECLATTSGDDSVVYSTEEMLEPAFQWSSPVVSETACPGSGLPGWAPWVIGIGGCACCTWSAMLLNCMFKRRGIPEEYPLFWAVWSCPFKTARWIDDRVGSQGKGGGSSSSGGGGGCGGGGGGGCGGGG